VVTETPEDLPTTGNRIIMDATVGKEKIQIIDQAKNQIIMNAVEGSEYIKLSSPRHDSQIVLGDVMKAKENDGEYDKYGIYIYTTADYKIKADNSYWKHIEGTSTTTCFGAYSTFVGGAYTTVVGGLYTSIAAVGKIDICLGAKLEIMAGAKVKLSCGPEYKLFKGGKFCKYSPTTEEEIATLRTELTSLMETKIQAGTAVSIQAMNIKIEALETNIGSGALKVKCPCPPPPPLPPPPPIPA